MRIEYEYDYSPHLLANTANAQEGIWRYSALLPIEYHSMALAKCPLHLSLSPKLTFNIRQKTYAILSLANKKSRFTTLSKAIDLELDP